MSNDILRSQIHALSKKKYGTLHGFFPPHFSQVLDKKLNVLYCKRIGNKEDQPTRCPSVFAAVRMATASDISFF